MIKINGAKNLILPLLASTVLSKNIYVFNNFSVYTDISTQLNILSQFNVKYSIKESSIIIDSRNCEIPDKIVFDTNCRGTYYFVGSAANFEKELDFYISKGCDIDERPIDFHLNLLDISNVSYKYENNILTINHSPITNIVKSKNVNFKLQKPSVGATINALLMFVFNRHGCDLYLENYAKDPYIFELIKFLNKIGGNIYFDQEKISIINSKPIFDKIFTFDIISDPIEAITYIIYSALNLYLNNESISTYTIGPINIHHLGQSYEVLKTVGIFLEAEQKNSEYFYVKINKKFIPFNLSTNFFPGVYTDAQPFFTLLASFIDGKSEIFEYIYDNRFKYIDEYINNKTKIQQISKNNIAIYGNKYKCKHTLSNINYDLRADMSLMLLEHIVNGISKIDTKFIDRGYKDYNDKIYQIKNNINILENFPLKKLSNIRIGGYCKFYVKVFSEKNLISSIKFAKSKNIPYRIIGSGCNIYFSDYFDGLIIHNHIKYVKIKHENESILITIGSGNLLQDLVDISIENNFDIHELSDIPGTIGAAIYGNAGAYGKDIKHFLSQITVYDETKDLLIDIDASSINLDYRTSDFKKLINKNVIVYGKFIFKKSNLNKAEIELNNKKISKMRREKFQYHNTLGSVYKNLENISVGSLLDKLNIKNSYIHNIYISKNHSNIWINSKNANHVDLDLCIEYISKKIKNLYNLTLELEIEKIE